MAGAVYESLFSLDRTDLLCRKRHTWPDYELHKVKIALLRYKDHKFSQTKMYSDTFNISIAVYLL